MTIEYSSSRAGDPDASTQKFKLRKELHVCGLKMKRKKKSIGKRNDE